MTTYIKLNIDHTTTLIQNINKVQKELYQNKQNKLKTIQFFDITTQYQNTTYVLPKENTQKTCLTNPLSAAATLPLNNFKKQTSQNRIHTGNGKTSKQTHAKPSLHKQMLEQKMSYMSQHSNKTPIPKHHTWNNTHNKMQLQM